MEKFKLFIFPLILFVANSLQSQELLSISKNLITNDSNTWQLGLHNQGYFNSNGFNNKLLYTAFSTNEFTVEDKLDLVENTPNNIRGGGDLQSVFSVSKRMNNTTLFFNVQERFHSQFTLSKDAYLFALNGNAFYQDQTLDFSGTSINTVRFQAYGFGLLKESRSKKTAFGFRVNLLNGKSFNDVNISTARLYTAPLGAYLDVRTQMEVYRAGNKEKHWFKNSGSGASFDVFFKASFPMLSFIDTNEISLVFEVNDAGFFNWHKDPFYGNSDTVLTNRRGLNLLSSTSNFKVEDSLIIYNVIENTKTFASTLPFFFNFSLTKPYKSHLITFGLISRDNALFKNYYFLEDRFLISKSFTGITRVGAGGYGKPTFGLGVEYSKQDILISLRTNTLLSQSIKSYGAGNHLLFGVAYNF